MVDDSMGPTEAQHLSVSGGENSSADLHDSLYIAGNKELQPGTRVGEYEVRDKIGEGGFGTVYRGEQPVIGKQVAIKVLKRQFSAQPEASKRFISEARAVNQIQHRYIIDIFSFGKLDDGRLYYVMNYLDGRPLEDFLQQRGRFAMSEAVPLLRAIAEAVDAAHDKGIAHRDLKPDNVFITSDGGIQLLDFGIAKLMGENNPHKTQTGVMMGTPMYMSPEQCRGRSVDHRTDVYAAGVIAFQLLTGKLPFDGRDAMDIIVMHLSQKPKAPSEVCPELPTVVDAPILHMLAKDPAARPASLTAAVAALEEAISNTGVPIAKTLSDIDWGSTGAKVAASMGTDPTIGVMSTAATAAVAGAALASASAPHTTASDSRAMTATGARSKWRTLAVVAAVVAVAAAGAAIALVSTGGDASDGANAGDETAEPPSAAATPVEIEPPAPSEPRPAVAAAPAVQPMAAPATVSLDIRGVPDNTEVVGPDGTVLGLAPGAITIDRGDEPVELTLRRDGYASATRSVVPSANTILDATMDKLSPRSRKQRSTSRKARDKATAPKKPTKPAKPAKPAKKDPSPNDIEDPF